MPNYLPNNIQNVLLSSLNIYIGFDQLMILFTPLYLPNNIQNVLLSSLNIYIGFDQLMILFTPLYLNYINSIRNYIL